MNLAPICVFTYNRLEETKQTITALQNNFLAKESELFVFSDGPRNEQSVVKINEVRNYLKTIEGFKTIEIIESKENKGLAKSIISGVTTILERYSSIIVIEDDLVTTPNFLDFMNSALSFYSNDEKIFSISGYTLNLPSLKYEEKDFYFGYRASSWGWGIWKDRWLPIDWELNAYADFLKDKRAIQKFKRGGSDMPRMLRNQMTGKIDSWAIRFCFHQFKEELYTVFPTISKLASIGFSSEATHTSGTKRFLTRVDTSLNRDFKFDNFKKVNEKLAKEFASFFSLKNRILNQINQRLKF